MAARKKSRKKSRKKFTAKQRAHHASMRSNPLRKRKLGDVAKHMSASLKRGLRQIDSVAEHMAKSLTRGHR